MKLFNQLKNIVLGSYEMMHLKKDWCGYIGNSLSTFLWAFLINLVSIPVLVYLVPNSNDPAQTLPPEQHIMLMLIMMVVVLAVVFLLSLAHRRHKKFALIYAGITYATFIVSTAIFGAEAIMNMYEKSLYALDAPLLSRGLLMLAAIWMVVVISFVFKSALEIRAAISLLMASVMIFIIIAGQLLLQMTLFPPQV